MLLIIKVYQPKVEENRTTLYLCGYAGAVEKVLALHKSNRLRHIIIQPTCRGRPVCLPLSAVLHSRNRLRRMVLVSINRVNECINRANQRVTGGHASPPLPLYGILFQQPHATTTPWKGFTFCIYARVLHNVTPIDLLAQSAVLLRLPSFHKRVVTLAIGH